MTTTYCCSPDSQPLASHGAQPRGHWDGEGLTVVDPDCVGIMGADKGDVSKRAVAKICTAVASSCAAGR